MKTPATLIRIPETIKAAALEWLAANGNASATLSETMVVALCHHIGRPELVTEIRGRGRPKSSDAIEDATGLSTRAKNILASNGVTAVPQLRDVTTDLLRRTRGCGASTVKEIERFAARKGVRLRAK